MMVVDKLKKLAMYKTIDHVLENPEENIRGMATKINSMVPDSLYPSQRKAIVNAIDEKNNWYELLMKVMHLNPVVANGLLKTFVVDANLLAWNKQEKMRDKYKCNIPWAILLDPTSACNLNCVGCWAAEYGHSLNLSYETINSIIEQGKALGVQIYIYTGGEPLVRKKDLIKLCEAHPDCAFLCFTNGTLIDEGFCQEMIRVKNFIPAISAEGFEEATDARRGDGTYKRVEKAMDLLKEYGLPFGVSCCFTSENASSIASEEYLDYLIDKGALFQWIFTYMPIGVGAPTNLMATPEQREYLYHFVREERKKKPIFTMDFWNDGEFVGGCIAGGRRYLHINAAGDVEPCVFCHYSNANIHDTSLLDALRSPIFMAYYNNQPFNDNLLRPCPILDNDGKLAEMIDATGAHSTDLTEPEDAHDLCAKCSPSAEAWAPVAQRLWDNPEDERFEARQAEYVGQATTDITKLKAREAKTECVKEENAA